MGSGSSSRKAISGEGTDSAETSVKQEVPKQANPYEPSPATDSAATDQKPNATDLNVRKSDQAVAAAAAQKVQQGTDNRDSSICSKASNESVSSSVSNSSNNSLLARNRASAAELDADRKKAMVAAAREASKRASFEAVPSPNFTMTPVTEDAIDPNETIGLLRQQLHKQEIITSIYTAQLEEKLVNQMKAADIKQKALKDQIASLQEQLKANNGLPGRLKVQLPPLAKEGSTKKRAILRSGPMGSPQSNGSPESKRKNGSFQRQMSTRALQGLNKLASKSVLAAVRLGSKQRQSKQLDRMVMRQGGSICAAQGGKLVAGFKAGRQSFKANENSDIMMPRISSAVVGLHSQGMGTTEVGKGEDADVVVTPMGELGAPRGGIRGAVSVDGAREAVNAARMARRKSKGMQQISRFQIQDIKHGKGTDGNPRVGFLLFSGFEILDAFGPMEMFGLLSRMVGVEVVTIAYDFFEHESPKPSKRVLRKKAFRDDGATKTSHEDAADEVAKLLRDDAGISISKPKPSDATQTSTGAAAPSSESAAALAHAEQMMARAAAAAAAMPKTGPSRRISDQRRESNGTVRKSSHTEQSSSSSAAAPADLHRTNTICVGELQKALREGTAVASKVVQADPVNRGALLPLTYGPRIVCDYTLQDCPDLDVLIVPGGIGTRDLIVQWTEDKKEQERKRKLDEEFPRAPSISNSNSEQKDTLPRHQVLFDWLTAKCIQAKLVVSICTGSSLLGQTGLIDRMCATTNKNAFDWVCTTRIQVNWIRAPRWVEDGKFVTSSGVSAGTDVALHAIALMYSPAMAMKIAQIAEYSWNPDPDFTEHGDSAK